MDEQTLRDLQEEQAQLRQLCDSPGWALFVQMCAERFDRTFEDNVASCPSGMDDLIAKTWRLGECVGTRMLVQLPALRLMVLDEEIKAALPEEKDNDDAN